MSELYEVNRSGIRKSEPRKVSEILTEAAVRGLFLLSGREVDLGRGRDDVNEVRMNDKVSSPIPINFGSGN